MQADAQAPTLSAEMTINDVVLHWPDTVGVFQLLGLDTCCGGSLPVEEAAKRHGLNVDSVLMALERRTG